MPITAFLEQNARYFPNEVSLVEINPAQRPADATSWREFSLIEASATVKYRREMTWLQFDMQANRVANLLLTRGVRRDDKVGILLMNCLEWLPIYFGILKAGAVAVPMNYRFSADEIQYCVDLADVSILFFGPDFIERVTQVKDQMPGIRDYFFVGDEAPDFSMRYLQLAGYCSTQAPPIYITDDDNAAIYFSSGTTGFPKAILHAHHSLMRAALTEQKHHGQTHDDVFLCIPPLYHTGAKMHWFGSLVSCSKAVLLRGVKPEWILQTVSDEHVSIVWLLVPWAQDILDALDQKKLNISDYSLDQWRLMHIGAQPVPPSLIRRWKKVFPHHEYDTNYGLSESIGPGCVHLGIENIRKVGAIGIPGYGWEARIVDSDFNDVEPGEVGELAVRGDGVMKCYYKNPEATAEVMRGEWLLTGDMAKTDMEGFIYLVDRKKDVIITGGENLYPVQIEDFLRANDKIKDAAVIGLPDTRLGEIAAAIIELKDGVECTEEEINEFCLGLPRYKRPRKIIFAPVPRNATGKIEKPALRKKYVGVRLVEQETSR